MRARMYLDGREAENESEIANLFADPLYQFLTTVFPFQYPMVLLEIKISLVIIILQTQKLKKVMQLDLSTDSGPWARFNITLMY